MTTFQSHAARVLTAATAVGEDVLVTDDHGTVTGFSFTSQVRRLAWTLADLGYGPGQTVGIAAGVTIRALALRYAAGLVGCTTVFCPEAPELFGPFVMMVRPDLLVVGPELVGAVPSGFRGRVGGRRSPGLLDLGELASLRPASGFADRSQPGDVAVLVSSGGTSGRPKASRRSFAAYLGLVAGPANPARRQLVCTPLTYVAQVLTDQTLIGGGRVVLQPRFDPEAVLRAVETQRITHVGLVEPLVADLVAHPDLARRDLRSLVAVTHIGATAPAPLRRRWLDVLGPVLVNPYGSSECGIATALTAPEYGSTDDARLASAGRALPGAELRIERADGSAAEAGETGRIVVRTTGAADGYVGEDAPTGAFRADGWFLSGDLGSLDRDGYLTVRGRAADQLVVDGRRLLPIDLETALYAHPQVRYAAAVPLWADREHAFGAVVTLAPGTRLRADELLDWVARHDPDLASSTVRVLDAVPVTPQGKPDRIRVAGLLGAREQAA